MITSKECAFINKIKSHTKSVVEYNQNKFLPVFNTGKFFNTDRYHYLDRLFSYGYYPDEPERSYSIIYVENMPYKSLFKRRSNSSFMSTIDRMVYDNELVPFLLFINKRFIPWERIQIIHDYNDTWLKINDNRYNYYAIKEIKMLILPYNIGYLSIEPDYIFNRNFEALKSYINDSAVIKNDKLYIDIPYTNDDYIYERNMYNVGFWMYNQIKLQNMNILSEDRYNKLRKISIIKNNEDGSLAFSNTVNIFDKDSYIHGDIDAMCNIDYDNVLFRFNDDGELSSIGDKVIYLMDKNEISVRHHKYSNVSVIIDNESDISNKLSKNNFIIFRNNLICNDLDIVFGKYNHYLIREKNGAVNNAFPVVLQAEIIDGPEEEYSGKPTDLPDSVKGDNDEETTTNILPAPLQSELNSKYDKDEEIEDSASNFNMFIFYKEEIETAICHKTKFNNKKYMDYNSYKQLLYNEDYVDYLNIIDNPLDFELSDKITYEDNFDNAMKTTINYDATLLNDLYDHCVISKCITGTEANKRIQLKDSKRGLIISTNNSEHHETYALVFVNGELIKTYSDMIVHVNYLFIPVDWDFRDSDVIEFLYFLDVNNNELRFNYNKNYKMFDSIIPKEDLKLFSTDVNDMLIYNEVEYDLDSISFPVYNLDEDNTNKLDGRSVIAVSSKKFIYQRLYVDQKSYKVILDKRFRYCDNQGQYVLFINGRVVDNYNYLITIPKITRPFDNMYIYTSKFFNPEDRIELFYLPHDYVNINKDYSITLDKSGYITCDRTLLDYPLNNKNYMFFINGKKIPSSNIKNISTNMVRILRDTSSVQKLDIYSVVTNDITYMKDYLKSSDKSEYEILIDEILATEDGIKELDFLIQQFITMSDTEDTMSVDVDHIALVNEIVRDFWVSSGYDYNSKPFVYDYELDDYITTDDNGNTVLPALDAFPEININKSEMHYLYFKIDGEESDNIEIGRQFVNPYIEWEYSMPPYSDKQYEIKYQKFNGEDIDTNLRILQLNKTISTEEVLNIEGFNGFTSCDSTLDLKFYNGIYYGLVNEDLLDGRESDIYSNNPTQLLYDINKILKPERETDFTNFVIGNNKYFIFGLPKRLAYDKDGRELITFFLPDITSEEFLKFNNDDKTKPLYTDGTYEYDIEDSSYKGHLVELDSFRMELLADFSYTNIYGYTEDYVIFKSNGYFTRLYDDTKFNIYIR